jgi:DNA-binding PadR family transcriptional regulator
MSDKGLSTSTVSEQVFLILLSLAAGRKHGYAILDDVEAMSGRALVLSTSTLYSALGRLEREVLVGHVEAEREVAPGLPRKVYELTPGGLALLQGEAARLAVQCAVPDSRAGSHSHRRDW